MNRKLLMSKLMSYPEISDYNTLLDKKNNIDKKNIDELNDINREIELYKEKEMLINLIKSPSLSPELSPSLRPSLSTQSFLNLPSKLYYQSSIESMSESPTYSSSSSRPSSGTFPNPISPLRRVDYFLF